MDRDRASSQRAAPVHFLDLQGQVLEADRVVPVHRTLELEREDQIQITTPAGDKSAACLGCRNLKASIELGHILLAQKTVRFLHAAHAA